MKCLWFLQGLDEVLDVTDDVLVLTGVTRADSGVYQCQTLNLDSVSEVSDDIQLTVHCE